MCRWVDKIELAATHCLLNACVFVYLSFLVFFTKGIRQAWNAEVLDPDTYGYQGVQPDEAWPLAGGGDLLGAGQLQWSPAQAKQVVLVEFNLSWYPHPRPFSRADAVLTQC